VIKRIREKVDRFLVVEMNMGQMIEDVRLAVEGARPVHFYGRVGGMMPVARDIFNEVKKLYNGGAEQ
jgi:2-oxoglutarate ferredoxin oxidoreductase subunit alpha